MSRLGFDINQFGENKLVVYAVPKILTEYVIDFEVLLQRLLPLETINFVTILEEIFATKACKAAIKA
jgi:DNA mismatch repair ATPase MutL